MSAYTAWQCPDCKAVNRGRHIRCFGCGRERGQS